MKSVEKFVIFTLAVWVDFSLFENRWFMCWNPVNIISSVKSKSDEGIIDEFFTAHDIEIRDRRVFKCAY
jgi:hypothetical protein